MNASQPVEERERLYRLIIRKELHLINIHTTPSHELVQTTERLQLRYDGYESAATSLARNFSSYPPTAPSSRLSHLVNLGLQMEGEASKPENTGMLPHIRGQGLMDLEFESDESIDVPPAYRHDVTFVTSHKGAALCAVFSHDGRLVATGSADTSIRMLDVERMMTKSALGHHQDTHPIIRTLYDHSGAVLTLDFHPTVSVLASGSSDTTIKFFDYSKPSVKRCYRMLQEVASIRCLKFHPSGDHMLVGTEQSTVRLYDVNTFQCFVSSDARDQHSAAITSIHYALDGRIYVTGSNDGSLKVWDGVSNRCINTFKSAHGGEPVGSVRLSKNSKFVLTSGVDGHARLWELSSGNCLNNYKPNKPIKPRYLPTAAFNHTEDYVLMGEEGQNMVFCWETRTTQSFRPLFTSHQGPIRALVHSPLKAAFLTCGDDSKVRFFCHKES